MAKILYRVHQTWYDLGSYHSFLLPMCHSLASANRLFFFFLILKQKVLSKHRASHVLFLMLFFMCLTFVHPSIFSSKITFLEKLY
jgi:hypothetical protein